MIGVGILGGTGYGAGELVRLLVRHPKAQVVSVSSSSAVGKPFTSVHTHLDRFTDLVFEEKLSEELFKCEKVVIFSALPHGVSSQEIQKLLAEQKHPNLSIVDLSGDLRLATERDHQQFYHDVPWEPALRKEFVYGLSELSREEIRNARHVANPGCLATACALALLPLRSEKFVGSIVLDAKTGTSGAGRSPQAHIHHPLRHGNFEAYKVLAHRHEPEVAQALGGSNRLMFVPHLLPVSRGIFVSAYLTTRAALDGAEVRQRYEEFYRESPFIRFREGSPTLHDVIGTNFCDIAISIRGDQVVVTAALDNLVKGMAGQAIQNMNLLCGLDEGTGLFYPSLGTT